MRSEGVERRGASRFATSGVASLIALAAAASATGLVHARMPATPRAQQSDAFVPDPALAKLLSFGFDAVVADYYWLIAIQAVGGERTISHELGVHLGRLIDVVTTLDPWVDHPYRFAAVWLTESEGNVRTANRLLERGIAHHPDEWRNRFYLGFNLFYYLMLYEQAAERLYEASQLAGSPPYLPRLVARLRSETADIDVAEAFLLELARETQDENARQGYLAGLDEIEVEKKARFLDRARDAFDKLHGRDITTVDELVSGPHPLLRALPNPEPESLPKSLRRGSVWQLDLESDAIVSSYYGHRYRLHFASWERTKAERWAAERERRARGGDRAKAAHAEAEQEGGPDAG